MPDTPSSSHGIGFAAVEAPSGLRALLVDDEAPALSELAFLLRQDHRIGEIRTATSGTDGLRVLGAHPVDVVFCDIKMPGLDGIDFARVLARFAERPQIVFVTAYDKQAVHAFEVRVTDYLMKPVRADRLAEAVRRVRAAHGSSNASGGLDAGHGSSDQSASASRRTCASPGSRSSTTGASYTPSGQSGVHVDPA